MNILLPALRGAKRSQYQSISASQLFFVCYAEASVKFINEPLWYANAHVVTAAGVKPERARLTEASRNNHSPIAAILVVMRGGHRTERHKEICYGELANPGDFDDLPRCPKLPRHHKITKDRTQAAVHCGVRASTAADEAATAPAGVYRRIRGVVSVVRRAEVEIEDDALPWIFEDVLIVTGADVVLFVFGRSKRAAFFMRAGTETCCLTTARSLSKESGAATLRTHQKSPLSRQFIWW